MKTIYDWIRAMQAILGRKLTHEECLLLHQQQPIPALTVLAQARGAIAFPSLPPPPPEILICEGLPSMYAERWWRDAEDGWQRRNQGRRRRGNRHDAKRRRKGGVS